MFPKFQLTVTLVLNYITIAHHWSAVRKTTQKKLHKLVTIYNIYKRQKLP